MSSNATAVDLLQLPDTALLTVLQCLDGKSLNALSQTHSYFNLYMPVSGLKLTEHVARERVLALHEGDLESASRFKYVVHWGCQIMISILHLIILSIKRINMVQMSGTRDSVLF